MQKSSPVRLAPVVDAITVDGIRASVVHLGEGRYDFDDILAKLAARPADPAAQPGRFALYNLSVDGGEFDFIDKAKGQTQRVRDLHLAVPFVSTLASERQVKESGTTFGVPVEWQRI